MQSPIYEMLKADGSIVINKKLAHSIGLHEAILYSELLSRYFYFADRDMLTESGYFYNTIEDLKEGTTLSDKQQRRAIKNLESLGLIELRVFGLPAKRHFKIIEDLELLQKHLKNSRHSQVGTKGKPCVAEETKQYAPKGSTNNTKNNTKFNNTKNNNYLFLSEYSSVLSVYENYYKHYTGRQHPRLSREQLESLGCIIDYTSQKLSLSSFARIVEHHFENLPKNNDGNILAFYNSFIRYLEREEGKTYMEIEEEVVGC